MFINIHRYIGIFIDILIYIALSLG
jgi:hypothetical protein